jgi:hypothetical protein
MMNSHTEYNPCMHHLISASFWSFCQLQSKQERLEQLAVVVAHLFARHTMHPAQMLRLRDAAHAKSSSVVLLPPMPSVCQKALQDYNQQVKASVYNLFC